MPRFTAVRNCSSETHKLRGLVPKFVVGGVLDDSHHLGNEVLQRHGIGATRMSESRELRLYIGPYRPARRREDNRRSQGTAQVLGRVGIAAVALNRPTFHVAAQRQVHTA